MPQLDAHVLEPGSLDLPLQMILAVLQYMTETPIGRHPEVVVHRLTERQVDHVAQSIEAWRGAYHHAPCFKSDSQPRQNDLAQDREVFDDLGEEDRIEPAAERLLTVIQLISQGPVPPRRFNVTVPRDVET